METVFQIVVGLTGSRHRAKGAKSSLSIVAPLATTTAVKGPMLQGKKRNIVLNSPPFQTVKRDCLATKPHETTNCVAGFVRSERIAVEQNQIGRASCRERA